MKITLAGTDREQLMRMQKRLRCAAAGLSIDANIDIDRDNLHAMNLGARHGPIAVAQSSDGQLHILMHGLEQVEIVEQRLLRWFADQQGKTSDPIQCS